MTKIYTKTGDSGTTSLAGGERVSKLDVRVEAYGTVDELGAHVAMLTDLAKEAGMKEAAADLVTIAKDLMKIEALLATSDLADGTTAEFDSQNTAWLEELIDNYTERLPEVRSFIIPGGAPVISECHICRTVCRRAERRALESAQSHPVPQNALNYLNRLSDYFYTLARRAAQKLKIKENLWIP